MKKKRWILLTTMATLSLVVGACGPGPTAVPPTAAPTATPAGSPTPVPPTVVVNFTPAAPPATANARDTWTRAADGMVMVYVPAGRFWMGDTAADDQADGDEMPQHKVYLDAFWIDRTEVSNAQFRNCVAAGACQAPVTCSWGTPTYDDGDKADHPVVCVDWDQAQAYCRWAGGRLPTEAEWEKAARGNKGQRFPWGNGIPDCSKAQYGSCGGQTVPVGSKAAGASPYGALDMAGNASEWVADWYAPDYYASSPEQNPPGGASGPGRVVRGGAWNLDWRFLRAARRNYSNQANHDHFTGFRCVAVPPGD
jgi:formylglycine-generating enzyme required for sulfatase activity